MDFTPVTYADRARNQRIPVASEATRQFLSDQLNIYRPAYIVELGAAIGSTTCRLGEQCADWQGEVVAYEISYPAYQLARRRRNYRRCRNIHVFHTDIVDNTFSFSLKKQIDFVFIDGMKAQYAHYLKLIRPFCHSGTCIIVDDVRVYADKMDAFRNYLTEEGLHRELIDLEDGDGVVKILL